MFCAAKSVAKHAWVKVVPRLVTLKTLCAVAKNKVVHLGTSGQYQSHGTGVTLCYLSHFVPVVMEGPKL